MSDHGTDVPPIDTAKFRSHCQDWLGFNEYAVDECFALCDEVDRLRGLLARALPWIDPNDRHEDYLLTVEIRKALGEGTGWTACG